VRTDHLINALVQDQPPSPRWLNHVLSLAVAAGTIAAGSLFFLEIGFRPDLGQAVETVRFLFKFVVTLSLAVTATGLLSCLARPGAVTRPWVRALATPALLLGLAVIAELVVTPAFTWRASLIGSNSRICLTLIPLLAIAPLACLLLALRQSAPTRPGLAGAVAGLAASGIAATFYAANCTDDSGLFVATWYPLAAAIVVAIGYTIGSRILRW
jgi:hypothetical protein